MLKILIVGPAWVGDMVMAQSLFKQLRLQNPSVEIDVLAPAWSIDLLARMPEVNKAIVLPFNHGELKLKQRYQFAKKLQTENYQQAIVLPNSFKSALIPWFAKIPIRTGWLGEARWFLLNDIHYLTKKNKQKYAMMVQRFLKLASFFKLADSESTRNDSFQKISDCLLPQLTSSYPQQKAVIKKFNLQDIIKLEVINQEVINQEVNNHIIPDNSNQDISADIRTQNNKNSKKILVLCPGAEFGAAKRWPESHFASVAIAKIQAGWKVFILGSTKDKPIADKIMQLVMESCSFTQDDDLSENRYLNFKNCCFNFCGQTTLADAIDLLSLSTLIITNDSGLMHIAAALNKPLIALYGPTSPGFTPPLSANSHIISSSLPCAPCFARECPLKHHNCLKGISAEKILSLFKPLSFS